MMADGSMRNIWDILNDVNTEQKLPASTTEHATPKYVDSPAETNGGGDAAKSVNDVILDTKRLQTPVKTEPIDAVLKDLKPKASFSFDVIRNRLKIGNVPVTTKEESIIIKLEEPDSPINLEHSSTQKKCGVKRRRRRNWSKKRVSRNAATNVSDELGSDTEQIDSVWNSDISGTGTTKEHIIDRKPQEKTNDDEFDVKPSSDLQSNLCIDKSSYDVSTEHNDSSAADDPELSIISMNKSTMLLRLDRCITPNNLDTVVLDQCTEDANGNSLTVVKCGLPASADSTPLVDVNCNGAAVECQDDEVALKQQRAQWRLHKQNQRERQRNKFARKLDETIDAVLKPSNDIDDTIDSVLNSSAHIDDTVEYVTKSSNHVDEIIAQVLESSYNSDQDIDFLPSSSDKIDKTIESVINAAYDTSSYDDVVNLDDLPQTTVSGALVAPRKTLHTEHEARNLVGTDLDYTNNDPDLTINSSIAPSQGTFRNSVEPHRTKDSADDSVRPVHHSDQKSNDTKVDDADLLVQPKDLVDADSECGINSNLNYLSVKSQDDVVVIDSSDQDDNQTVCNCEDSLDNDDLLEAYGSVLSFREELSSHAPSDTVDMMGQPRKSMPDIVPHLEHCAPRQVGLFPPALTSRGSDTHLARSMHDVPCVRPKTSMSPLKSSRSQPNLINGDVIDVDTPLDLSKKEMGVVDIYSNLSNVKENDLKSMSLIQDDAPLDLSVKKVGDIPATSASTGSFSHLCYKSGSERDRSSIFQAFCLTNKHNRQVSPVRPHIRGKPVGSEESPLLHDQEKTSALETSFKKPLFIGNGSCQDYTVFSVKNRIANNVKNISDKPTVPQSSSDAGRNKLTNSFRISGGVVSNASPSTCPAITTLANHQVTAACSVSTATSSTSTVLNVPNYLANRTSVDRTNPPAILTDDHRPHRRVPTAHVKPSTIEDTCEVHPAAKTCQKSQSDQTIRHLLEEPPKLQNTFMSSQTTDATVDDVRGMPVLSPHRDNAQDNSHLPKFDSSLDITPPPPSLVRQIAMSHGTRKGDEVPDIASEDELVIQRAKADRTKALGDDLGIYVLDSQCPIIEKSADACSSSHGTEHVALNDVSDSSVSSIPDVTPRSSPSHETSTVPTTHDVNMSAFIPSVGRTVMDRSSLSHHIAFTYDAPSVKKYRMDISQTRYYNSMFGDGCTSALDVHNELEASIAAKSKKNALQSAFPTMQFSNDWRKDLLEYKISHLRTPRQLVHIPKKTPPKFMQNVEKFLVPSSKKTLKRKANNKDQTNKQSISKNTSEPEKGKKRKVIACELGYEKIVQLHNASMVNDDEVPCITPIDLYAISLVPITKTDAIDALTALKIPIPVDPVTMKSEHTTPVIPPKPQCKSSQSRQRIEDIIQRGNRHIPVEKRVQKRRQLRKKDLDSDQELPSPENLSSEKCVPSKVLKRSKSSETVTSTPMGKDVESLKINSSPIEHSQISVASDKSQNITPPGELSTRKSSRAPRSPRRFSEVGWVYPIHELRRKQMFLSDYSLSFDCESDSKPSTSKSSNDSKSSISSLITPVKDGLLGLVDNSQSKSPDHNGSLSSSGGSRKSPRKKTSGGDSSSSNQCSSTISPNITESSTKKRARHKKSLLDQLANTDGYVAEKNLEKASDTLLIDPSLLSREERALQRAMMKFSEMESKFLASAKPAQSGQVYPSAKTPTSPTQTSSRKKAGELKKKAIKGCRPTAMGENLKHKFDDFKPIVLLSRTRLQATGPDGKPAVIYDKITPEKRHEPVDHVARPETTTITEKPKTSSNRCAAKKNLLDSMLDSLPDLPPVSVYNFPDDEESEPSTTTAPQAKKPHKVKGQWGSSHIFGRRYRGRGRGGRGRGSHSKSTLHGVRRSWPARTKDSWRGKVFSAREAIFEPPPRVEIDLAEDASLPATRLSPGNMSLSPHSKSSYNCILSETQSVLSRAEDDAMSLCSSTHGDFPRHLVPIEVKRLNACRDTGETILHKAARMNYYDIVLWCCRTHYVDVNARDHAGFAALHETCVSESVEVARCLLEHGAEVNVASRLDGVRPLHDAIERDNFELVRLFLAWGADHTLSTYSGRTALKIARTQQMREFLMAYFVDLNGASQMDPETPWEVPIDITVGSDTVPAGSDLLVGLPEDDCPELSPIVFEQSDLPFVPCYLVNVDKATRPRNYMLLSDLLSRLKLEEGEFRQKHSYCTLHTKSIATLSGPECYSLVQACGPSHTVTLVEYDEKVRNILQVEKYYMDAGSVTHFKQKKDDDCAMYGNMTISNQQGSSTSLSSIGIRTQLKNTGLLQDLTGLNSPNEISSIDTVEQEDSDRSTIPAEDDYRSCPISPNDDELDEGTPPEGTDKDFSNLSLLETRSTTSTPCFEDQLAYDCKGCSSPEVDYDDEDDVDVPFQTTVDHAVDIIEPQESGVMTRSSSSRSPPEVMISLLSGRTIITTASSTPTRPSSKTSKMEMYSPSSSSASPLRYCPPPSVSPPRYCPPSITSSPQNTCPRPLFIVTSDPNPSPNYYTSGPVLRTPTTCVSPRKQSLLYLLTNGNNTNSPQSSGASPIAVSSTNSEASDDDFGLRIAQVCSLSATDAKDVFGSDPEML